VLNYLSENASRFSQKYGNIPPQTLAAIRRGVSNLESQGGANFFGEPAMDINDLMRTVQGKGVINLLAADKLMQSPLLYSTTLLWLLSELFENLPETGDLDKPKLVFFFDEAHLLFKDTPKTLVDKIEQVVRLVRSKGVGVYFVTQSPSDIPDTVLGQLSHRFQHALRAFTPKDQKAVRAAAQTMRANPKLEIESALQQLQVGEALVSLLDVNGSPTITERARILPPRSKIGVASAETTQSLRLASPMSKYQTPIDRESAFEVLGKRQGASAQGAQTSTRDSSRKNSSDMGDVLSAAAKSAARVMGGEVGRALIRGLLGSLMGNKGRR
jgi:uncharacterized protein